MTLPSTRWTLLEGAQLCALLEPDLIRAGAHVALAGSVLTTGFDCDPHNNPEHNPET